MNTAARLAFGAAVGALVALLAHPRSRPFAVLGFTQFGPSHTLATSSLLPQNLAVLPQPTTLQEAAIWMHVGAGRLTGADRIRAADLQVLSDLAQRSSKSDPDNAFWPQMAAVYQDRLGQKESAAQAWREASFKLGWNDFQTGRLLTVRQRLTEEMGGSMAWQSGRVAFERSKASALAIELYGGELIRRIGFEDPSDITMRYATLQNGRLMRLGARSLEVGLYGVSIIEFSSFPARIASEPSPRKLLTSRNQIIDRLREIGLVEESRTAGSTFNENEAWYILTERGEAANETRYMILGSLMSVVVPSSLLAISIVGFALFGLGALLERYPKLQRLLQLPIPPIVGAALGILLYVATELPLLAIATAACFAFLGFGPPNVRTIPPRELGPMFSFTIGLMGAVLVALLTTFWAGLTTPAVELLPRLDVPTEYYGGATLFLGLAVVVMLLSALIAPMWAIVQRVSSAFVFIEAIKRLGLFVGFVSFGAGVVLIPVGVIVDSHLAEPLSNILQNEPNFYLNRYAP